MMQQLQIQCSNCSRPYPAQGVPFRCRECGGIFNFTGDFPFSAVDIEPGLPGIWKYRHAFPLERGAEVVSLGEGNTSLEWREVSGRRVAFKLEYQNPTGSFKDRGAAVLVSLLLERQVDLAVEDSSGNAGAAFAAYAQKSGISARVYIPDATSAPKRKQIEKFGAQVVRIMGPRSNASEAVLREVSNGTTYASHAYLPHAMAGYATAAYECLEQMGEPPGTIIVPAGQGNFLLGLMKGFQAAQQAGLLDRLPLPVGVQALACAPLWAFYTYGLQGMGWVTESATLAEGVRVRYPLRGDELLAILKENHGLMSVVEEQDILPGRDQLDHLGFSVEPTSAIVWQALKDVIGKVPDPILVILTGAGYKSP